jgi:hypothetical protein
LHRLTGAERRALKTELLRGERGLQTGLLVQLLRLHAVAGISQRGLET